MPLVSISDAQREPIPDANFAVTVYHGLPRALYRFRPDHGEYLAFIGRIAPEKRVDRAIEIAKRAGLPLKIAAKVDDVDREYYETLIKPLLRDPCIEYLGEIGEGEKDEFLGGARALLFPIDWPEPFGLVMVEAMACGTPVIAFGGGSVPEIIDEGETGFIVDDLDDAVAAVHRVGEVDRRRCREVFEERFTATRMACDYLELYSTLLEARHGIREGLASR